MATQQEKLVRIEDGAGRRAAVTEADFKHRKMAGLQGKTYEDAGYSIVSYEDGTPYGGDAEPTKYAISLNTGEIGVGGTDHTDIDGNKLTADQVRSAGVAMPDESAPTRSRRSAAAPPPVSGATASPADTQASNG